MQIRVELEKQSYYKLYYLLLYIIIINCKSPSFAGDIPAVVNFI